ncbi:MAG TPA: nicotinate (nicotinamide) nucleotide adenylyltransferase [Acidobacteriaceae bacterium]|nr:nicotinate (nicotinamide) nucleotide adenylyltransferase [Acidobacteriaceae bacterium]
MRIGFFGGSFDPPHCGHITLAVVAANQFSLDRVLLAPVGVQPLKNGDPATDFLHRYAMTALAAQADPRLQPSLLDAPLQDGRPNYTVDTLARLQRSLQKKSQVPAQDGAETSLFTLLGADSFLGLRNWYQPERLLALCNWIVASRPGYFEGHALATAVASLPAGIQAEPVSDRTHGEYLRLRHADGSNTNVWFLPQMQEDVSATALRAAIPAGAWNASLLPAPVAEYIRKTGLYDSSALVSH